MATTREILDHHLKCLVEGDLEGIMADYAPVLCCSHPMAR